MSHVRGCVFDPDLQVAAKNALRSIDNPVERLTRLLASTKALITYQLPLSALATSFNHVKLQVPRIATSWINW